MRREKERKKYQQNQSSITLGMIHAHLFLPTCATKSPSRDTWEPCTYAYYDRGQPNWATWGEQIFFLYSHALLVVKSMILGVDKLGSAKYQSRDLSRVIYPPWDAPEGR